MDEDEISHGRGPVVACRRLWRSTDNRWMQYRRTLPPLLAASIGLGACTPTLDWREFEPEGSGIVVNFPCRTDRHARKVSVAGMAVRMEMLVCTAGGATYALAFIDLTGPEEVASVLAGLRAAAAGNLGVVEPVSGPLIVRGMTPNPMAARLRFNGRRPDGAAVQEQAAFFAKGLRVYQASVIGPALVEEGVDTFFGGLKLSS
jgi:hypothetical protein